MAPPRPAPPAARAPLNLERTSIAVTLVNTPSATNTTQPASSPAGRSDQPHPAPPAPPNLPLSALSTAATVVNDSRPRYVGQPNPPPALRPPIQARPDTILPVNNRQQPNVEQPPTIQPAVPEHPLTETPFVLPLTLTLLLHFAALVLVLLALFSLLIINVLRTARRILHFLIPADEDQVIGFLKGGVTVAIAVWLWNQLHTLLTALENISINSACTLHMQLNPGRTSLLAGIETLYDNRDVVMVGVVAVITAVMSVKRWVGMEGGLGWVVIIVLMAVVVCIVESAERWVDGILRIWGL